MVTWPGADFIFFQTPVLNGFTTLPTEWLLEGSGCLNCCLLLFLMWAGANVCSAGQWNSLGNNIILGWFPSSAFSVIAQMLVLVQQCEGARWEGLEEEKTVTNRMLDCFISLEWGLTWWSSFGPASNYSERVDCHASPASPDFQISFQQKLLSSWPT